MTTTEYEQPNVKVIKAYRNYYDAECRCAETGMNNDKRKMNYARNKLSKTIETFYPDLKMNEKIAIYTQLQEIVKSQDIENASGHNVPSI
jgi:hypothetical protein